MAVQLKQFGGELGIAFVTTDHHALITHPDVRSLTPLVVTMFALVG
jgi:hypothetical protein